MFSQLYFPHAADNPPLVIATSRPLHDRKRRESKPQPPFLHDSLTDFLQTSSESTLYPLPQDPVGIGSGTRPLAYHMGPNRSTSLVKLDTDLNGLGPVAPSTTFPSNCALNCLTKSFQPTSGLPLTRLARIQRRSACTYACTTSRKRTHVLRRICCTVRLFRAEMASWLFQSRGGGFVKMRLRPALSSSLMTSLAFWSDTLPSGRSSKRPGTNCVL
jgi:hypothetical protein